MNKSNDVEILLVEDNPLHLQLTLRALREANLANQIHIARDGAEAQEFIFCEGAHAGRQIDHTPKVILLDLKLPEEDRLEALKRIKGDARTSAILVVPLTSWKVRNDVVESYQLGMNTYIVKPMKFEGFFEAMQQLGKYWLLLNPPSTLQDWNVASAPSSHC